MLCHRNTDADKVKGLKARMEEFLDYLTERIDPICHDWLVHAQDSKSLHDTDFPSAEENESQLTPLSSHRRRTIPLHPNHVPARDHPRLPQRTLHLRPLRQS